MKISSKARWILLLLMNLSVCEGCHSASSTVGDASSSPDKNELLQGKQDGLDLCAKYGFQKNCDFCQEFGWYGDGECDQLLMDWELCLQADPDCDQERREEEAVDGGGDSGPNNGDGGEYERRAEIRLIFGTPTLYVNDQPTSPTMFFGSTGELIVGAGIPKNVGSEWQQIETTFGAWEQQNNAGLMIQLGNVVGTVWIDDIRFVDLEQPDINRVRNGSFDDVDWQNHFVLYQNTNPNVHASANASVHDGLLEVSILDGGTASWHVSIAQTDHSLEAGHRYRLSLRVRAAGTGSEIPGWTRPIYLLAYRVGGEWLAYTRVENPVVLEEVAKAANHGVHLHSFNIPIPWDQIRGQPPAYGLADDVIERVLEKDPNGLLIPRIDLSPPSWWYQQTPGQEMIFSDGNRGRVSVASEQWRGDANAVLRSLVQHLEERYGNHILGYHPTGQTTGEWFYDESWQKLSGFEEPMRLGFARWAQGRYGTVEVLGQAWGESVGSFYNISLPSLAQRQRSSPSFKDPVADRKLIDFAEYLQTTVVETILQFGRTIREASDSRKLVVVFYGYLFELSGLPWGPLWGGHLALEQLIHSADVDVICSPVSYYDRGAGKSGPFMAAVDSVRLHGKLWLNEDDVLTHLSAADSGFERAQTPEQTRWIHTRNFANILVRRMGTWWMDLLGSGWLNEESVWANLASLQTIYQRGLGAFSPFAPEIAVIVDEKSLLYLTSSRAVSRPLLFYLRDQLNRIGAPVGTYLLSDLVNGRVPNAKLYLFLGSFALTGIERQAISGIVQSDQKVSVFFYGAGYVNEGSAAVQNMTSFFGMQFSQTSDDPEIHWGTASHSLLTGLSGLLWKPQDQTEMISPLFAITPSANLTVLARYGAGQGAVAAALLENSNYTTVYLGAVTAPALFLRNCAKKAGVFLFVESDDVVQTDGRFLAISAQTSGMRNLRFPVQTTVRDAVTDAVVANATTTFPLQLVAGETRLFRLASE